jgi:RyR domain
LELPNVELVSAKVHEAWMNGKIAKGITTRKAEDGEELMVPYSELSEPQKDQDRQTVLTVYAAIRSLE